MGDEVSNEEQAASAELVAVGAEKNVAKEERGGGQEGQEGQEEQDVWYQKNHYRVGRGGFCKSGNGSYSVVIRHYSWYWCY